MAAHLWPLRVCDGSTMSPFVVWVANHSAGEGKAVLLDPWGPAPPAQLGQLFQAPAHPQDIAFATSCLKSWGTCKLLNASSHEDCICKKWANNED